MFLKRLYFLELRKQDVLQYSTQKSTRIKCSAFLPKLNYKFCNINLVAIICYNALYLFALK